MSLNLKFFFIVYIFLLKVSNFPFKNVHPYFMEHDYDNCFKVFANSNM